jgi:hypothetical protein
MRQLTGITISRWRNGELPEVQSPRVNLLGETTDQSQNKSFHKRVYKWLSPSTRIPWGTQQTITCWQSREPNEPQIPLISVKENAGHETFWSGCFSCTGVGVAGC